MKSTLVIVQLKEDYDW